MSPTQAALFVSLLVGASACGGPCAPSSDVRLVLTGDAGDMASVKQLVVGIQVDQGQRHTYRPDLSGSLSPGRALLLTPSVSPAGDSYRIVVDVTALSADETSLLFGRVEQTVGTHACNEVSLALAGASMGDDLAVSMGDLSSPVDLSMNPVDQAISPDLAPCVATTPDEDGDGRGDQCDVCAANADPTLTDGDADGVPDVCDPDPAVAGNKVVYFQPFNAMPAGWTGTFSVTGGHATVSGTGGAFVDATAAASDPAAPLPAGVLMQTYVRPTAATSGIDGGLRIFLWTTVGSAGFRCSAEWQSVGDPMLQITELGVGSSSASLLASGNLAVNQPARLRLWQKGTTLGCEMARSDGGSAVTVTRTIAAAPAGPLRPGIGVGFRSYSNSGGVTAEYSSVFAVTDP